MFKSRLFVTILITLCMLTGVCGTAFAAYGDITVMVDGNALSLPVPPVIVDGRTLVPARGVAEALGGSAEWNSYGRKVTITTADKTIELTIDSNTAYVNGSAATLDVPAQIVNDRTMIPLRFVGEALGADVNYSSSSQTVTINYFSNMSGTLKVGGSTTVQPVAQSAADYLNNLNKGRLSITVTGGGSGVGKKDCASGALNVGNASAPLSDSEKASYPDLVEYLIGRDAIAVIVNNLNPVKSLTKQQVYDIFTGKITNWKDVGGDNAAIFVQDREAASGTRVSFIELALNKTGKIVATATPHNSNGLVSQAVAANKNAIGFISFGYIDVESARPVTIDGADATVDNAFAGKWPYVRPLETLTKGKASGLAAMYINFLRSPKGQEFLKNENYMALSR